MTLLLTLLREEQARLSAERNRVLERLTAIDRLLTVYADPVERPAAPLVDGGRQYTAPRPDGTAPMRIQDAEASPAESEVAVPETPPRSDPAPKERDGGSGGQANQPSAAEPTAPAVTNSASHDGGTRWTEEEESRALAMLRDGLGVDDVAAAMPHRTHRSIREKCKRLLKVFRAEQKAHRVEEQKRAEAAIQTDSEGPGEPVEQQAAEDGPEEAAPAEPVETVRVNLTKGPGLGASVGQFPLPDLRDEWTRDLDYDLLLSLGAGEKTKAWCARTGVDLIDARKRFWEYAGNPPSYDQHMRAIRVLKAIIEPVAAE